MGSNKTTIGNTGARPIFSFTAAGQDSGPLMYSTSSPIYHYSLVKGCSDFTLSTAGNGTGLLITLYFTDDIATAEGTSVNPTWYLVTAPAAESPTAWSNPLQNIPTQNVCYFKANVLALRAVSSPVIGGTIAGTTILNLLASF